MREVLLVMSHKKSMIGLVGLVSWEWKEDGKGEEKKDQKDKDGEDKDGEKKDGENKDQEKPEPGDGKKKLPAPKLPSKLKQLLSDDRQLQLKMIEQGTREMNRRTNRENKDW